jgi:hypothetical protein
MKRKIRAKFLQFCPFQTVNVFLEATSWPGYAPEREYVGRVPPSFLLSSYLAPTPPPLYACKATVACYTKRRKTNREVRFVILGGGGRGGVEHKTMTAYKARASSSLFLLRLRLYQLLLNYFLMRKKRERGRKKDAVESVITMPGLGCR